jgi:hypothetical protein
VPVTARSDASRIAARRPAAERVRGTARRRRPPNAADRRVRSLKRPARPSSPADSAPPEIRPRVRSTVELEILRLRVRAPISAERSNHSDSISARPLRSAHARSGRHRPTPERRSRERSGLSSPDAEAERRIRRGAGRTDRPDRSRNHPSGRAGSSDRVAHRRRQRLGSNERLSTYVRGRRDRPLAPAVRSPAADTTTDSVGPRATGVLPSAPSGARESRRRDARPTTNAGLRRPSRARRDPRRRDNSARVRKSPRIGSRSRFADAVVLSLPGAQGLAPMRSMRISREIPNWRSSAAQSRSSSGSGNRGSASSI